MILLINGRQVSQPGSCFGFRQYAGADAQRLSLILIFYGIGESVRWGRRKCTSSHPTVNRRSSIVDAKYK